MSIPYQLIACSLAAYCFAFLLNQPRKTIWVSALIAPAGYAVFLLAGKTALAYFLATMVISVLCEGCARLLKKTVTLFLTSALVPLVPGVGLYRTMRFIVEGDYGQAVSTGVETLMGIFAIALAITFTSILFYNVTHRQQKENRS